MSRMFIDCFSSLDDLKKRDRSDPDVLLRLFQNTKIRRVSTFEINGGIMSALRELEKRGAIRLHSSEESPYPWHGFDLLEDE